MLNPGNHKIVYRLFLLGWLLLFANEITHSAESKQKIFYVGSYSQGDNWSDGILRGITSRLIVEDVEFDHHYLDSKGNRSAGSISSSVDMAKQKIQQLDPDVIIVSDDEAAQYLLADYFLGSDTPFVFCGVNWDPDNPTRPAVNTTGMVEVTIVRSMVDLLQQNASGARIGMLTQDTLTGHNNARLFAAQLDNDIDTVYYVNNFADWKERFLQLQQEVDMMILDNPDGLKNWDLGPAIRFVNENTSIPVGASEEWLAPLAMITIAKFPEEQGWWAANAAMEILEGKLPKDIPLSKNQEGKLYVNLSIADRLEVTLAEEILELAEVVRATP